MINYRNIFNPTYNYIGIIFIIIISLSIIILQKKLITSIYKISKTFITSSLIIIIITTIFNLIIEFVVTNNYKIFIKIITTNVINNLYTYSFITLIISLILKIMIKTISNSNKINQ